MISKMLRSRSKLHRRVAGLLALAFALIGTGVLYSLLAPEPQTAGAQPEPGLVREGQQVYNNTCITCHGANLEGVAGRGPSLIGVGEAAGYFQTETGRMPAVVQGAQEEKKPIIASLTSVTNGRNIPGGNPIGGLGPQSEGLIAFIVGMAALLGITLWIGAKA